ncbi:hypothetical protein HH1059_11430 [Halorhodospira halochloris]|uniref:Uncharacterized protein n=1 Tax=Halorhodospira halochloris TaxID=1052 RepID=A0A2Z6EZK1_HALHR|nr:hypothetical protein HH1059_11430 [Halorhodospira halochloris]
MPLYFIYFCLLGTSKNSAGATIRPGVEDAVNPSLEASWRHPWRQDLHTGADGGAGGVFRGHLLAQIYSDRVMI